MKAKKILTYAGLSLFALAAIGSGALNVVQYRQIKALKTNPETVAQQENQALIARVRSLMILPDEEPTVATVTDVEKLRNQEFFRAAKQGDKVLIFTASHKAVLYSPGENKIVEVAPLNTAQQPTEGAAPTDEEGTTAAEDEETE